jgi:hypothetical protein
LMIVLGLCLCQGLRAKGRAEWGGKTPVPARDHCANLYTSKYKV